MNQKTISNIFLAATLGLFLKGCQEAVEHDTTKYHESVCYDNSLEKHSDKKVWSCNYLANKGLL